jgi:hypothetical protein
LLAICIGPVLERVLAPPPLPPALQASKKNSQPVRVARAARTSPGHKQAVF